MAGIELRNDDVSAGSEALAAARAGLSLLDERVFAAAPKVSLGRHLGDLRAAVARMLGDPAPAATRVSGDQPWSLALLADEPAFNRHYDAVAMAIADLFTLKVHLNIGGLHAGLAVFAESLAGAASSAPPDYRRFIDIVTRLISSLAARRIVSYSAMVRERANRTAGVILAYPDEVSALAFGAATYSVMVKRLTGQDPAVPLSNLYIENAAAILRRRPDAAAQFRDLLQLATPWV